MRDDARTVSRRGLLRGAGAAAAAAAAAPLLQDRPAKAQQEPPVPAMRSPTSAVEFAAAELAAADAPALPPLSVIALNRAAFGPRPGDLAAFNALGGDDTARLTAYVDRQLNPAAIDDAECAARLAAQGFTTLGKSRAQLWADHVRPEGIEWGERTRPMWETERATLIRAVYSNRQLLEVLADFWHNHFNVYGWDYWVAPTFVHYDRDVIRANALGNFRTLLGAVAKSTAMLYYLDNQSNSGGKPNENYARELFELHTLGAENYLGVRSEGDPSRGYIDDDVYGATTCFTGWRVNQESGEFLFDAQAHFPYDKFVLGVRIPANQGIGDGEQVLDMLANHPGTARHIARKLCRRLIADHPPESVVQAAADVFIAKQGAADQLRQVVRTILLSNEFRSIWGEKIKRPLEYSMSLLRATAADFAPVDPFFWSYDNIGQPLFSWRPPNGYPDFKEEWSSTMPMLQRWRHCNRLLEWRYEEGENADQFRIEFAGRMPASIKTAVAIVDWWSRYLTGSTLPESERLPIVGFMAAGRNPEGELPPDLVEDRLRYMIGLILVSPTFLWR